jgi:protein-L-isoaspartate(D-aspartate) O-methyltransferase
MTDFATARARMIDTQLRTEDVSEPAILSALGEVPRERFVPEKLADLAYVDRGILLKEGSGGAAGRYLMRPKSFVF